MTQRPIFSHHFLIAMPSLKDFNFVKSVIYLYEHNEEGAVGMIINKPMQLNLGKVLEHLHIDSVELNVSEHPVLMGGPVGQEHGFILFYNTETSPQQEPEILVSASKELLTHIAQGQGPKDFIITLGYSGWEAGQLEEELARNDWLIVPFHHDILFDTPFQKRWEAAAALIGIDIHRLSGHIGHA
ncbi:MAG: hypothetical protein A3F41_06500 [Coxiella sp. RIFCSPHIGHO2_12_FULL_44_14]|nr:MAG: hypothetical protein A3F41_06500 [Coxiella sp. RIFCSPHIGHO2_12_FULL_44_14]